MRFWKGGDITSMTHNNIFVFGSNPEGRHGRGAAKTALNFGAKYGIGRGLEGNSYALVTKHLPPWRNRPRQDPFVENVTQEHSPNPRSITYHKTGERSLSFDMIKDNISDLYWCAGNHSEKVFFVAYRADSMGLSGYTGDEWWNMFTEHDHIPDNIRLHNSFRPYLLK